MCGPTGAQKEALATQQKITSLLTSDFQLIFGKNQNILDSLVKSLSPQVQAGPNQYGFSAAEEAARRTQAAETFSQAGRNEANAVRGALASQGGGMNVLPNGSQAAIEAGLAENIAQKQAQAQLDITTQGYDIGRQNYFESAKMLGAAPGELETPTTQAGSAAMGAASDVMGGATQIQQAQDAWMAPAGAALGGIVTKMVPTIGGGGGASGSTSSCWIAEAIYGVDDIRTHLVRAWLNTEFTKQRIGRVVMAAYRTFGQRVARLVREIPILKNIMRPLFDAALRRAEVWKKNDSIRGSSLSNQ